MALAERARWCYFAPLLVRLPARCRWRGSRPRCARRSTRRPVGAGGNGVHVVAEEFQPQVVLRRAARVAGRAAVEFGPGAGCPVGADVGVLHHSNQGPRAGGVDAERCRECVVHQVCVGAAGTYSDGRVVPAIACRLRGGRGGPGAPAIGGVAHEDMHRAEISGIPCRRTAPRRA